MRRLLNRCIHVKTLEAGCGGFLQFFLVGSHRAAHVQRAVPAAVFQLQDPHIAGQFFGHIVPAGTAEALSVMLSAYRVCQYGNRSFSAQRFQQQEHHTDGVPFSFRIGAVSGNTGGGNPYALSGYLRRIGQARLFRVCADFFSNVCPAFNQCPAFAGNDIDPVSGGQFQDFQAGFRFRSTQFQAEHAFLRVDQREARVRAESHIRNLFVRAVVGHVFPAFFLVAAEDQADALLQRNSRFPDRLHGKQRCQCRTLVVVGSPAVHPAVLNQSLKRRFRPSVPDGHHIQVTQHGNLFLGVAQRHVTGIAVKIPYLKAHLPGVRHGGVQHIPDFPSERRAGFRFSPYGGNPYPALQCFRISVPIAVNQLINSLFHGYSLFLRSL